MNESKHTKGPWEFSRYSYDTEELEKRQKLGIEPIRILTNEGQAPIMSGSGEDRCRVALVDCQATYKRGQGYKAECEERDANACLIAAAPDLLSALEALCSNPHLDLGDLIYTVREREVEGWDGPSVKAW